MYHAIYLSVDAGVENNPEDIDKIVTRDARSCFSKIFRALSTVVQLRTKD